LVYAIVDVFVLNVGVDRTNTICFILISVKNLTNSNNKID